MRSIVIVMTLLLLAGSALCAAAAANEPPRMTKEELLPLLGKADVVVFDARIPREWEESQIKIKGAVRLDPKKNLQEMLSTLPKEKTIVLYCA